MNKIIAIVGMSGSGRSVASTYLESMGYSKVYFGGVTMKKLKEEGLEVTPENEKMMRNKLREEHGMGAFAKILLPEIKEKSKEGNVVLDGLYSWDELAILKEGIKDNLTIICIVVDKDIRYSRVAKRKERSLTAKEVNDRDIAEIEQIAKGGPIAYADYYILNNGDLEEYKKRLDEILKKIDTKGVN